MTNFEQGKKKMLTFRYIANKNPELLSIEEAASLLGISVRTIHRRQSDTDGFPKSFFIQDRKNRKFFNRKQIQNWINKNLPAKLKEQEC